MTKVLAEDGMYLQVVTKVLAEDGMNLQVVTKVLGTNTVRRCK